MVRNVADKLAIYSIKEAQSSLDKISLVGKLLRPSLSSSLKQYYLDSDLE